MQIAPSDPITASAAHAALGSAAASATVAQLRQRIAAMEPARLDDAQLPTDAAFAPLFHGGSLRRGCAYTVEGSLQLALALMSQASQQGVWCGIVGFPRLGVEAVRDAGVDLSRLVWIPSPGASHVTTLTSLVEVLGVVLTDALTVSASQTERIATRLRENRSTLIAVDRWAGSESQVTVEASQWFGLEQGFGILQTRELRVVSRTRVGFHRCTLRFNHRGVQRVDPARPAQQHLRAVRP